MIILQEIRKHAAGQPDKIALIEKNMPSKGNVSSRCCMANQIDHKVGGL